MVVWYEQNTGFTLSEYYPSVVIAIELHLSLLRAIVFTTISL